MTVQVKGCSCESGHVVAIKAYVIYVFVHDIYIYLLCILLYASF
jgi:hypothetical protein